MFNQLAILYFALTLTLLLPGWFLLQFLFGKSYQQLYNLEKLLLSFALSSVSVNIIMLLLNFLHIDLNRKNIFITLILFCLFFILCNFGKQKIKLVAKKKKSRRLPFSYQQLVLFVILLGFSVFLRGIYLADGIFPRSTDFGHHMYWAKYIKNNQTLPSYNEKFIIGEHLPFATISILSDISVISSMPIIVLFLFNIFSLIVFFLLTYYLAIIFLKIKTSFLKKYFSKITPFDIALWGLFVIGILYPLTAPQAKFISGGVVGNIIGNFLFLTVIYSFLQTIIQKSNNFAIVFLLLLLNIIYTHHLSTLVLGYSLITILVAFIFLTALFLKFNLKLFFKTAGIYFKLFFNLKTIPIILLGIFLLWQVRLPSYLNFKAITTAVGTPEKITRIGISLNGIINRIGAWRVMFAGIFLVNVIFLLSGILKNVFSKLSTDRTNPAQIIFSKKNIIYLSLSIAILIAWTKIIFLMSWKPAWLKIDIPSNRIITYLTYPIALMSGFGLAFFFKYLQQKFNKQLLIFLFLFFLNIGLVSGFAQDIADNIRSKENNNQEIVQTYLASEYLAKNTLPADAIIKDHIYLKGDTWMKIFFMRGYKYPLSRTYNRRYEDKYNKHETCTRDMIAIPNSKIGQECFNKTHTKYIVLKKGYDDAIFLKLPEFQEIYSSGTVRVFEKK